MRLVHAYETLSCPKRRALYDATLGDGGRGWRAAASTAAAEGDPDAYAQSDEPAGRTGAVVRDPRRELNDALARAYHGPAVDLGAAARGVLPLCCEGEERTELLHDDLLQLCSGRTLLGFVRHLVLRAVEAGGRAPQLCAVEACSPVTASAPQLDELRLLSHTGTLVSSARRRPRATHDSPRPGSPWLHKEDGAGDLEGGAGEGDVEVWLHDGNNKAHLHCCVTAAGGGFGYGAIKDTAGVTICSVFLHSTPFVTHLHFYAMNGAMEFAVHACERWAGSRLSAQSPTPRQTALPRCEGMAAPVRILAFPTTRGESRLGRLVVRVRRRPGRPGRALRSSSANRCLPHARQRKRAAWRLNGVHARRACMATCPRALKSACGEWGPTLGSASCTCEKLLRTATSSASQHGTLTL